MSPMSVGPLTGIKHGQAGFENGCLPPIVCHSHCVFSFRWRYTVPCAHCSSGTSCYASGERYDHHMLLNCCCVVKHTAQLAPTLVGEHLPFMLWKTWGVDSSCHISDLQTGQHRYVKQQSSIKCREVSEKLLQKCFAGCRKEVTSWIVEEILENCPGEPISCLEPRGRATGLAFTLSNQVGTMSYWKTEKVSKVREKIPSWFQIAMRDSLESTMSSAFFAFSLQKFARCANPALEMCFWASKFLFERVCQWKNISGTI